VNNYGSRIEVEAKGVREKEIGIRGQRLS